MNESTNQPAIGTRISFYGNLRTQIGQIAGYTPDGCVICVAEEGGLQFIKALETIRIVPEARRRDHYDPAVEGMLAGRRDATHADSCPFQIGERVDLQSIGGPAKIVRIDGDAVDIEVIYDGLIDIFMVPARHLRRSSDIRLNDDDIAAMGGEIDHLRDEVADMRRQIADLIHERTALRHAMQQIRAYRGGRYTDDADVMREIAEAALHGEPITPRR